MQSWLDFWNAPNAIYVSRRHQDVHYAKVLSGIRRFMPAGGAAVVLDWGCGDALAANDLAQSCRTLLLYDRADSTRSRLLANYAGSPKVRVIDDVELDAVAPASVDLIIVNSVVQYLDRRQFSDALRLFHRLLKSDGKLLLGDIIAPDTPLRRPRHHLPAFRVAERLLHRGAHRACAQFYFSVSQASPRRRLCLLHTNAAAGSAGG